MTDRLLTDEEIERSFKMGLSGIWLRRMRLWRDGGVMDEWQPIETAPMQRAPMIVVIGVFPHYTTDPWCVWWADNRWQRWPHAHDPTHWMPLPTPPR